MAEQTMSQSEKLFRRAIWGALIGLGIFIGSVGAVEVGLLRLLGLAIGLLAVAAAFTRLPNSLASRMVARSGGKLSRFYLVWLSVGSIIVPLLAGFLPAMALIAGVPPDPTFTALIIGPAIGALLNLVVLVVNLNESKTS